MFMEREELEGEFEKIRLDENYIKHIIGKVGFYGNKNAKQLLKELIKFSKQNNLRNSYSWALYRLGTIYINEDNFNKADEAFHEAYENFKLNKNDDGKLSVITGFIGSKCMQHKYADAIQWAIQGVNLSEEANDIERLIASKCNIAAIYMSIEEYNKAIEMLDQIEDIPWIGIGENKIAYYLNRAICEREMNNLDKALYYLDYIKDLIIKLPNYYINWLIELSRVYIYKGLYSEAKEKILESITKSNEFEATEYINDAIVCLSMIDVNRGNYKEAIDKIKSIEEKIEKDKIKSDLKEIYNILRIAYRELKDYENAYLYLRKYEKIEKELRSIQRDAIISILDAQKEEMGDKSYKLLYEQNRLLYKIGQNITANLNKDNIFRIIANEIKNIFEYDVIQIALYNEEVDKYQYQLIVEDGNIISNSDNYLYEDSFAYYSIKNRKDILLNEVDKEYYNYISNFESYLKRINNRYGNHNKKLVQSLMVVPMIIKEDVKGIISIQNYNKNAYNLRDLITLNILSTYMAIALDNSDLYKKVKYNANYDGLTKIFNRRKVIKTINKLRNTILESKDEYYIAMIDLDNFKKINDIYGHINGDKVLSIVAKTIKDSIEKNDIIGRYGGEEFIIVVKDSNYRFNNKIENIRKNIESIDIKSNNGDSIKVTVSIGVEKLYASISSLEENISLADKSLYKAKNTGKNKVVY